MEMHQKVKRTEPLDHPRVRASLTCPLCDSAKDQGLVACWPCYRTSELGYGNPDAERLIDDVERELTLGF